MSRLSRSLPWLTWPLLVLSVLNAGWQLWQWQRVQKQSAELADGSLIQRPLKAAPASVHYAAGWLYEQADQDKEAIGHYAEAAVAEDPFQAAQAKLALGNLYLEIGLKAADVAAGGSHVRGLAQQELAREAYRGALRLNPDLREARYNLELLERLSPEGRVEGWSRPEERDHQLQQGQEKGWATMQDDPRRGLP